MKARWLAFAQEHSAAIRPCRCQGVVEIPGSQPVRRAASTAARRRSPRANTACTSAHSGESASTRDVVFGERPFQGVLSFRNDLRRRHRHPLERCVRLRHERCGVDGDVAPEERSALSVRSTMPWMSSSVSVGWPTMKYILSCGKFSDLASSTAASRSSSLCVLPMTRRRRSLPASGAMVSVCVPLAASARTNGTLIGSVRMELTLMRAPIACSSMASSSICE